MSAASLTSDDIVSAFELRRMSAADWAAVMRSEPRDVARYIRSAAEHGFKAAQVVWAQMLLDGRGVAQDRAAAYRWFHRAAELGSVDGINMVGRCHELGWGVPVDHAEAARWFRRAAEKGSDWGAYNLACMLLYGDGVPHDPAAALAWFLTSAERGNAKAMGFVGRCHEEGWGTKPDPDAALDWYRRAAEAGDCWAQYNLATHAIETGRVGEALAWLRRSLETGTPNFLQEAGRALSGLDDPDLAEIGRAALARAAVAGAPGQPGQDAARGPRRFLRRLTGTGVARDTGPAAAPPLDRDASRRSHAAQ
ncbi:tetratricopeptide repeat protein [Enterovirga aerilata]|uniref:Sel1 repeat family protein n=1 Tax=Enterovirga aerilata TaxID=2730920 RepID=A0A849IDS3_9HYPH|nr:tetratricopeptide repeat protein [Enterovirga sp. DB1703]NNM74365.1 sel1 repeat family protein [Enterovirga sp. DB1703]